MIKKLLSFSLLMLIGFSLTACGEEPIPITLDITETSITLIEGETYQIAWDTNDLDGIDFSSMDSDVLTISSSGLVTAIGEGETTVEVRSLTDELVSVTVTIIVRKLITLTSTEAAITLKEGETHLVVISSNDEFVYSSSNTNTFVVDEDGLITAKEEGTADLVVTSTYDDVYEITISITVEKIVTLELAQTELIMVVGDTKIINATSNDDLVFTSRNPDVATVNAIGKITAMKFGTAKILVTSVSDETIEEEITITVFKYTEEISITGNNVLITGMSAELEINSSPVGAYAGVTWESNNPDIVTIDSSGVVTGVAIGIATIVAKSTLDDLILDTYDIEVINVTVVDQSKHAGDTYLYMGVELVYGERLFSDIGTALTSSPNDTKIYIAAGTYTENINVTADGYLLEGINDAIIIGNLVVTGDNVTVSNLTFQGDSSIVTTDVDNFVFTDNQVVDITSTTTAFLSLNGSNGAVISNNTFTNLNNSAIDILDFLGGLFLIEKNTFSIAHTAINIDALREYDITTEINIIRNEIETVTTGIHIDLLYGTQQKQIEAIVRFNSTSSFTIGASSNLGNQIDFTLNHWGCVTMDYAKFTNIEESMLRGFYTLKEHIISEDDYNPDLPLVIEIVNPITEMMIGDDYTIQYSYLPMELVNPYIQFITSDPLTLGVNQSGQVSPKTSGTATITVRSAFNSNINATLTILINTTPGIELTPSNIMNNTIIGDSFTLTATPFPLPYKDNAVTYVSSNAAVATIDTSGVVNALTEGLVTFTVSLDSDPLVKTEYTIYVYDHLEADDLLDYLTMKQVSYSTSHSWTAYGFAFDYQDRRYESVSRYYFDVVDINTSKLVPLDSYGIRPGEPMDVHPDGVEAFNEDNIYWVVVHDTASTAPGSGARAHANYLYNSAIAGTALWVSWHYTVDDTYIYQSLPENERGYHAGDGSSLPLQGYYKSGILRGIGGGNRNGIGIEMSVQQDGDLYRTWQRTAKLVVDILVRNGMPITQQKYHNDFSGKDCPNTLRNAGLIPLFEEFVEVEFEVASEHPDAVITFVSNNPDYLDNYGRIIALPDRAMTVSYTITVTEYGETTSRTFYTYLPGTVH